MPYCTLLKKTEVARNGFTEVLSNLNNMSYFFSYFHFDFQIKNIDTAAGCMRRGGYRNRGGGGGGPCNC